MSAATSRGSGENPVGEVPAQELARAEERGAEAVREQLRAIVEEHRRVVRVRNQQVEVVEATALDEILGEPRG